MDDNEMKKERYGKLETILDHKFVILWFDFAYTKFDFEVVRKG